ncbi:Asp domain protein [Ceratobasidium sp. AG-Ba]|nr:Asp domain protein [Ceratobasidium sp. AG-Ba]
MSSFSRRTRNRTQPQRASSWETRDSPPPMAWRPGRALNVVESGGAALADAQEAFIDSRRAVWTRIIWSLPSEHDERVMEVLARIGRSGVQEDLARIGVDRYLQTERGALFCNASYTAGTEQLAVDWVTFRDTQMTRDKLLQQDVLANDPAVSVLLYVFRLASDKRWVALWRQRIIIPSRVVASRTSAISSHKGFLVERERGYVIKISPSHQSEVNLSRWASFGRKGVRV